MNFTKFVRTPFLQNTSGRLLLSFHALNQRFFKLVSLCNQEILTLILTLTLLTLNLRLISSSSTPKNVLHCGCCHKFIHSLTCKFFTCICRYFFLGTTQIQIYPWMSSMKMIECYSSNLLLNLWYGSCNNFMIVNLRKSNLWRY